MNVTVQGIEEWLAHQAKNLLVLNVVSASYCEYHGVVERLVLSHHAAGPSPSL